jgi:CheY-like chemotaxis protein
VVIRVLLVDDVEDVRRLVRTALRLHGGFKVVAEGNSGAEAVRLAVAHRPDVVVLDLGLPDLAGREVLRQIRENAPDSKVIIFSGAETHDAYIQGQVEAYVLKDADVDYLVNLLAAMGTRASRQRALDLPQALTSAALARRFVTETLDTWNLAPLLDAALLVTSELAANAVTHASSNFRVQLSVRSTTLRIDVADYGAGAPEPQTLSLSEEHGRGLHLIDALSTAWGIEDTLTTGKVVWAELALPSP